MAAKLKSASIALLLALLAILPAEPRLARATSPWYVATGGSDGGSCAGPAEPCATINAAIAKASPGDIILVATGTYTGTGSSVVVIDKDVTLSGGWDEAFTEATGRSAIDAQHARRGVDVASGIGATIARFSVANGYTDLVGGGIYNLGLLNLGEAVLSGNSAHNGGGGVYNSGTLTITDSTLSGNQAFFYGGAIDIYSGTVYLRNSTLSGNSANSGGGIHGNPCGGLPGAPPCGLAVVNSTLSGNHASNDGGAIDYPGPLTIANSTVSGNSAGRGGGIHSGGPGLTLRNTMLAGNTSSTYGPDCYGTIAASGYSLVGDTANCDLLPTTGDLTGVDPKLGPLQDNGGPTLTHALLPGSLAIDGGDPVGCRDHLGNPLTSDQRGFPRSGRCDMGAYERQPAPAGPYAIYVPCVLRSCPTRLYFDDFANPASGWPVLEDANVRHQYVNGEYRILVKTAGRWAGARPGFKASDYVAVADVRNATGLDGAYGILFGLSDDWSQFYTFAIDPSSKYAIWYVQFDGSTWSWVPLVGGFSEGIHPGTATNQLKVERKGAQIRAYANGQLLNIISHDGSTGLKHVGLIALSFGQPNVDVRFDNYALYPISCGAAGASLSVAGEATDADVIGSDLLKNREGSHDLSNIRR